MQIFQTWNTWVIIIRTHSIIYIFIFINIYKVFEGTNGEVSTDYMRLKRIKLKIKLCERPISAGMQFLNANQDKTCIWRFLTFCSSQYVCPMIKTISFDVVK